MPDIIQLGYSVDTSQVVTGETALDRLTKTTTKADAATDKLTAAAKQSGAAMRTTAQRTQGLARSSGVGTAGMRNLGLQLNQVAQQGAVTGNYLQALSIQLPDLLLGFGGVGIAIGIVAGVMGPLALSFLQGANNAKDLEERLDNLSSAVTTYRNFADQANTSTSSLAEKFGALVPEARAANAALATIGRLDAIRQADEAVAALTERFGGLSRTALSYSDGVMPEIMETYHELRKELEITDVQAATVVTSLEKLANAQSMQEKVSAANSLNEAFVRVFGSVENIPAALLGVQREALLVALQVAEIEGATNKGNAALERQRYLMGETRAASLSAANSANVMLAELQQQASLQAIIARHGADSAQAITARLAAERAVAFEAIKSRDISESLKQKLMDAWDAARGISGTNMAGPISAAADEAQRLSQGLSSALDLASRIAGYSNSTNNNGLDAFDPRNPNNTRAGTWTGGYGRTPLSDPSRTSQTGGRGGGGGGGTGRADAFQQDLQALIQSLSTERETLETWYAESEILLNDHRARKLLGEEEHKEALLALDAEYAVRSREIADQTAQHEIDAKRGAVDAVSGLLSALSGKSRTAAIALIAISKGQAIAQAIQNTAVAQVRALAELGPIAGPPAAARIAAFGKVQIAAIAATGIAQAASTGSSGGSLVDGATGVTATAGTVEERPPQRVILENVGNQRWVADMFQSIMDQIQQSSDTGVIFEVAR